MKWKTHAHGDSRIRTIFAFLPRKCTDGTTRWMEYVDVDETYKIQLNVRGRDEVWFINCYYALKD